MSTDTIAPAPDAVRASLSFAERSATKPFVYGGERPPGAPPSDAVYAPHPVTITNARPIFRTASLDREGFTFTDHPSIVRDFWDDAQLLGLGHPEAAELVKALTGATRVIVFDHIRRRRTPDGADPKLPPTRQPATLAHVDYTVTSGAQRVRDLVGEAAALPYKRAAIINLWRPIRHPARDWPLAVCDARSVAEADLVATDVVYPQRTGELYYLADNPRQRWFYVPDLRPDEALLFKCWDSDANHARFTPHSAFADPTTPPGTPPRESLEFRAIALWEADQA